MAVLIAVAISELAVDRLLYFEDSIYYNIHNHVTPMDQQPEYIAHPYMNFVNNPARPSNNSLGIRSDTETSITKPDSVFRILFLGGSTTYGNLVSDTSHYPYILSQMLERAGTKRFECLNGGMGGATSAEILSHYLFKYRYLQPDLIVVNVGINDAGAYHVHANSSYQPDYAHWRIPLLEMPELSPFTKRIMASRLVSTIVIRYVYSELFSMDFFSNHMIRFNDENQWFIHLADSAHTHAYNALFNNLRMIAVMAREDGVRILLVTEVIDEHTMPEDLILMYRTGLSTNTSMMADLADQHENVTLCLLDPDRFTTEYFVQDAPDGVHLNELGELLKAEAILPCLLELSAH